jgi:predicted phosphodiesterase
MKLALGSDLHLEFGYLDPVNEEGADVLILSGDIMVARDLYKFPTDEDAAQLMNVSGSRLAQQYRAFLKKCSEEFKHVIYVAGNHEFYGGKFHQTLDILGDACAKHSNVNFLEKGKVKIDDVLFVGGTLWTDMNKGDPLTQHVCMGAMNDYNAILNDALGYTRLRPAQTVERHKETLKYFKEVLRDTYFSDKVVVVGHHAPSKISIKPEYENDHLINGAYSSDLSEFILDHPQIKVWTHGHTHDVFEYLIGTTKIVCNPRGYVDFERGTQREDPYYFKYFEV